MFALINTPQTFVFGVALMLMLMLFVLEMLSLAVGGINDWIDGLLPDALSDIHHPDVAIDTVDGGAFIQFLSWLYVGRIPLLMLLVVFLTIFGVLGFALQGMVYHFFGFYLPSLIAVPVVWFATLPLMRISAKGIHKVLPKDETSAIDSSLLVGRVGMVVIGTATSDKPAQIRVKDTHGQTHYVMGYADNEAIGQGQSVLLIAQSGMYFKVITNPNPALVDE